MTSPVSSYNSVGLLSTMDLVINLFIDFPAFADVDNRASTVTPDGVQNGQIELSINGTSAVFESGDENGADIVEWTLDIEDDWLEDLLVELNEDDVFYDVGANLGVYSCFVLNELTDGEVIAFEPYPPNQKQLLENLRLNGDGYRVFKKALSNEQGELEFTPTEDETVGHATGTIAPDGLDGGTVIETIPGDRIVEEKSLPDPDIVKIDVEGSEPLVLEGMEETLSALACRLVYCEVHLPKESRPSVRDYDFSPEDVKNMIRDAGFRITEEVKRNRELHVKAER